MSGANDNPPDRKRSTDDGLYYEYSKAAIPIAAVLITGVSLAAFPHRLHQKGPMRIIPFDLSEKLRCPGPATSPALCANFVRILLGEAIPTRPIATSELFHVIRVVDGPASGTARLPGSRATSSSCPTAPRLTTAQIEGGNGPIV